PARAGAGPVGSPASPPPPHRPPPPHPPPPAAPPPLRLDKLEPFLAQLKQLDDLVKSFPTVETA
ncbi:hypothetical protein ACI2KL_26195, partial [Pseudomonas yamanorum]